MKVLSFVLIWAIFTFGLASSPGKVAEANANQGSAGKLTARPIDWDAKIELHFNSSRAGAITEALRAASARGDKASVKANAQELFKEYEKQNADIVLDLDRQITELATDAPRHVVLDSFGKPVEILEAGPIRRLGALLEMRQRAVDLREKLEDAYHKGLKGAQDQLGKSE